MNRIEVIAEIGSVHDGSFGNAIKLIEAVSDSGATAVKFQTHISEEETIINAPAPDYFDDETRFEYFKRTAFSPEQWKRLAEKAKSLGLVFISSPFSIKAIDLLEEIGVDKYKIASGEITNIPLLERASLTKKELIISSGMSDYFELEEAVNIIKNNTKNFSLLQCSSIYPCPPESVGLNVISELKEKFDVRVGFSDHTDGNTAAIAAVISGAEIIEKHFTFSKLMYGSDAFNAMEPDKFKDYCAQISLAKIIKDNPVNKNDLSSYQNMKHIFQKSIVAACNIKAGTVIEQHHLAYKKPASGMPPKYYKKLLGKKITTDMNKDDLFSEDFI